MRLAKGIKESLSTGFVQEYLQLFQYNMQGLLIRVDNPPTANAVTFVFKVNNEIKLTDSSLILNVSENTIDIPYLIVLYRGDILTVECTSCLDPGVGDSIFIGIY